jgi:dethiobiotin synthetase
VRGLFVTGTDTGVGKTILSAALLAAMSAQGERVCAYKPVVTGLEEPSQAGQSDVWPPDHELLAAAAGMTPEEVTPLRYGRAASPHLAAELAGERIDPAWLLAAAPATYTAGAEGSLAAAGEARPAAEAGGGEHANTLIVEGVGGLLVPFDADYTVRDFATALALPVLIAARPSLGTINHTLLTLQAARAAGLDVRAVVLTPWPEQPSQLERSNRETIERLGEVEVEGLGLVRSLDLRELAHAGATLPWQHWLERTSTRQAAAPDCAAATTAAVTRARSSSSIT